MPPHDTKVALLNAPNKDAMVREIEAFLHQEVQRHEEALLGTQFPTYHEYAAAFRAAEISRYAEHKVKRIIKRFMAG